MVLGRITASFLTHGDIIAHDLLATFSAFRSLLGTFAIASFAVVIRASEVLKLLLGLFLLLILADRGPGLSDANLTIIEDLGTLLLLGGAINLIRLFLIVNHASVLHSSLVIRAIALLFLIIQVIALFISDTVELLVDVVVFKSWTLLEGLATIVDHDNFLCLVHDAHMVQRSVRVNNVRLHIVFRTIEPFFLHVEVAATVNKDQA